MALFLKNVAFHGILLDALFEADNHEWKEVYQLLEEGIQGGVVQPLKTTVFERDRVEEAFRYMAQGKHIGKVVLQVGWIKGIFPLNPSQTSSCMGHSCHHNWPVACVCFFFVVFFLTVSACRCAGRRMAPRTPPLCLFQRSAAPSVPHLAPTSSPADWAASGWSWLSGSPSEEPVNWC